MSVVCKISYCHLSWNAANVLCVCVAFANFIVRHMYRQQQLWATTTTRANRMKNNSSSSMFCENQNKFVRSECSRQYSQTVPNFFSTPLQMNAFPKVLSSQSFLSASFVHLNLWADGSNAGLRANLPKTRSIIAFSNYSVRCYIECHAQCQYHLSHIGLQLLANKDPLFWL